MAAASNRPAMAWLLVLVAAVESEMRRHERVARLWAQRRRSARRPERSDRRLFPMVIGERWARHGRPSVTRQSNALASGGERWIPEAVVAYAHADAPLPSPSDPAGSRSAGATCAFTKQGLERPRQDSNLRPAA